MKQHFISIVFLIGFILFGHLAGAQNKINPTVEIVTDYQGKITEADKISIPYTDSLTGTKPSFSYQALSPVLNNKFIMQPVPAARMEIPAKLQDNYLGYFRGSLSYPLTPDLNFYLNAYSRTGTYFNLYINHHSFWGKVPLYEKAPVSATPIPSEIRADNADTRIGVSLQHFWNAVAIDLDLTYNNRYLMYHGHDTLLLQLYPVLIDNISDNSYMKDKLSQGLHIVQAGISLYSVDQANSRTNFSIDGNFNFIKESAHQYGNDPTSQSLLGVKAWFNHKLKDVHAIDVDLGVKTFNRRAFSNLLLHIAPGYRYSDNGWLFFAGINIEGVKDESDFVVNVYPKIAISYKAEDWFIPYVSATGGTRLNNYEKIITENPYILPGIEVDNSRCLIDLQAGVRGSINPYLSYQLNVGYSMIDRMYFFVNSDKPLDPLSFMPVNPLRNHFEVEYDNIKLLTFGGAITSKLGAFEALFKMQYSHYMMNDNKKAWHKPDLELGVNLRYKLTENFIFNVDGYFRSEAPVLLEISGWMVWPPYMITTTTPAYFNLGAMAEYRISRQLSAFAQITNLLNNNYQQYYLYYNPGITIGAGISIAF